jgi:mono/diheme cytochrome c family protein
MISNLSKSKIGFFQSASKGVGRGRFVYVCIASIIVTFFIFWFKTANGDEFENGKAIYADKCLFCHGIKGDGNGPATLGLISKPTNFTNRNFWTKNVDKRIADMLLNANGIMPHISLSEKDLGALISYMHKTFEQTSTNNPN